MVSDRGSHVRSSGYQQLFNEIMFSHDMLSSFSNDDSISNRLCPYQYDERLLDLEDQLRDEFWRIVESEALTDKQRDVIVMIGKKGMTQQEIAKERRCNQSSINKSLNGSALYEDGKATTSYGGSYRKLQEAVFADDKIKDILAKLAELREEKW